MSSSSSTEFGGTGADHDPDNSSNLRAPSELAVGDVVEGFRIERVPAPGDTQRVWEATQLSLDRRVALMFLAPDHATAEHVRRFLTPDRVLAARTTSYGFLMAMPLVSGETLPSIRRARMSRRLLAALCVAAVAAAAVLVGQSFRRRDSAVPSVRPGTVALGSALQPGAVRSVDCVGQRLGGSSPACTLVQTRLVGRPLVATRRGVIRRWIVQGAHGQLALQVLHRSGDAYVWGPRTAYQTIASSGVRVLNANLPLMAGDLVGLDVAPDTAIGIRAPAAVATTARALGPVSALTSVRALRPEIDNGPAAELLLRVDYIPGARVAQPGLITGPSVARLAAGRQLAAQDVELRPGQVRTVAVVRTRRTLALDLLAGRTRMARLQVTGANASGQLLDLVTFGRPSVRLRFRNPDGALIEHTYEVGRASLTATS